MIKHKASLFIQCIIDALYPEVAEAMVRVLERVSTKLIYPKQQTCCGQPAFNNGHWFGARRAAQHFIRIFENADCIISPSGSCVHMVRANYPRLFKDDAVWLRRARQVAAKTYEFSEYLVEVRKINCLNAHFDGCATYHDSCHLAYGLGIREQPRQLMREVRGLQLVEMAESDRCCCFGGTFAVNYAHISTAMLDAKIASIRNSGADTVVGCDMGCLMNIQGRLHRLGQDIRVLHLAQLLAGR